MCFNYDGVERSGKKVTQEAANKIAPLSSLSRTVEDAPASPTRDVQNRSTQDRGIGKTSSDEEDKLDAKLVGAYAAYVRGLTPWYAGGMLV